MKTKYVEFLKRHFGLTEIAAINLVSKHDKLVETGERWGSQPYYVAGQIADAEHMEHPESCNACKEDEAKDAQEAENA